MRKELITIYPAAVAFLTNEGGISLSEARSLREENANANSQMALKAKVPNSAALYNTSTDIFMSGSAANRYESPAAFKIDKECFGEVENYAQRYANSAFYAEATKAHKALLEAIDALTEAELASILEIQVPKFAIPMPKEKSVLQARSTMDAMSTAKNVGELVKTLSSEGIGLVAGQVRKALVKESLLKHISDFAKDQDSFLQVLSKAPQSLETSSAEFTAGLKVTTRNLAYSFEDYREIFNEFQEKHALHQKEFNGIMSLIKETLNNAEAEFVNERTKAVAEYRKLHAQHLSDHEAFVQQVSDKRAELKREAAALRIIE